MCPAPMSPHRRLFWAPLRIGPRPTVQHPRLQSPVAKTPATWPYRPQLSSTEIVRLRMPGSLVPQRQPASTAHGSTSRPIQRISPRPRRQSVSQVVPNGEQKVHGTGSLLGDEAVAEQPELRGAGQALGPGDPAFGQAQHPLNEIGGQPRRARQGGHRGGAFGHVLPAADGGQVVAPPAGRRVTAVRRFMPP